VYLVSHGWHVGLVLPREDLAGVGPPAPPGGRLVQYVEVGWGDGDYYPAKRGTLPLALRAAFHSRSSVLQVIGFDGPVAEMFPRSKILAIDLAPAGLAALSRHVEASQAVDQAGRPVVVAPAQYGVGAFYLARGRYRLADNSNTWVARGLKAAGCPIDVDAAVTAGAVLHQAVRFARVVRPGVFLRVSDGGSLRCGEPDHDAAVTRRASPLPRHPLQESLGLLELTPPPSRQAPAGAVDEELHHPDGRADALGADLLARHPPGDRPRVPRVEPLRREGRHGLHLVAPPPGAACARRRHHRLLPTMATPGQGACRGLRAISGMLIAAV
jgi:uncharacterized protein (TIGR02117 family)